jgi:Tfp pilus assembly ATPase PilU
VHTVSAATTVDRITSAFPPGQQQQVRSTLADSLRAVICQYLMKEKSGPGRVLAVELMVNNEAVSNLIRKGKAFQLPSVISTSREQGMQLMDTDLMRLAKEGKISAADAYVKAVSKKDFESMVDEEEKAAQQKRAPVFKQAAASAAGVPQAVPRTAGQPNPAPPAARPGVPAARPAAAPAAARPAPGNGARKP